MLRIATGSWDELQHEAKLIRTIVFMNEQNIPEQDEWDDQDIISQHFVAYDQDRPIATARLLKDHSVGRVAVLKEFRGKGIGHQVMLKIISEAQKQDRPLLQLSAQVHATSFYENLGFIVKGKEYDECGIPHIEMIKPMKESVEVQSNVDF